MLRKRSMTKLRKTGARLRRLRNWLSRSLTIKRLKKRPNARKPRKRKKPRRRQLNGRPKKTLKPKQRKMLRRLRKLATKKKQPRRRNLRAPPSNQ